MAHETTVACPGDGCGAMEPAGATEPAPDGTATLAFYQCPRCGRKAALMFESGEGASNEANTWVKDRIRETGSFFPSDYTPGRFGRFS